MDSPEQSIEAEVLAIIRSQLETIKMALGHDAMTDAALPLAPIRELLLDILSVIEDEGQAC